MAINQFEAALRPFNLALREAFGLDPDKTASSISADPDSVEFKVVGPLGNINDGPFAEADLRHEGGSFISAKFPAYRWTPEQRRAVEAYIGQFPRLKFLLGNTEAIREALRAGKGSNQMMVLPDDGGLKITRIPTWRDVIRAMRAAGFKLKVEEREDRYRKWIVPVGSHGSFVAEIWRQRLGGRDTWTVEIYGYFARRVCLENPEPAAVLAAAMLTRLIDGPVCGVDVTGLAEFTRKDQP